VAYTVDTVDEVKAYLRAYPGLSREGRLKLCGDYLDMLREHGDARRAEPTRRLSDTLFRDDYVFLDGGRVYTLTVVVDESHAVYGVLRVVYADVQYRDFIP
jgi:hypothetical protein